MIMNDGEAGAAHRLRRPSNYPWSATVESRRTRSTRSIDQFMLNMRCAPSLSRLSQEEALYSLVLELSTKLQRLQPGVDHSAPPLDAAGRLPPGHMEDGAERLKDLDDEGTGGLI